MTNTGIIFSFGLSCFGEKFESHIKGSDIKVERCLPLFRPEKRYPFLCPKHFIVLFSQLSIFSVTVKLISFKWMLLE